MPPEPQSRRVLRIALFVASAAAAAVILRFTWDRPLISAAVLLGLALIVLVRWVSRRRLRRALVSGNVEAVLREWAGAIARAPHASTMAPLMTATAFAANGWIEQARAALAAAQRGPAWEAALEHRLFLDTLLLTFEGDRDEALRQAERLARLPMPAAPPPMRERIALMRGAASAFARAFAHKSEQGDGELLERVARQSPLVHWAMRYASAIVAIDEGNKEKARMLLEGAPDWPSESAFRSFHDELIAHAR
jgi:hypothetical protein